MPCAQRVCAVRVSVVVQCFFHDAASDPLLGDGHSVMVPDDPLPMVSSKGRFQRTAVAELLELCSKIIADTPSATKRNAVAVAAISPKPAE